jgi:hypothetical protein
MAHFVPILQKLRPKTESLAMLIHHKEEILEVLLSALNKDMEETTAKATYRCGILCGVISQTKLNCIFGT